PTRSLAPPVRAAVREAPPASAPQPIGDATDDEAALLAVGAPELPPDVLLALPGSEGLDPAGVGATAIPDGGVSVGTPDDGALQGAVQLPYAPQLYTRRDASRAWATSKTVRTVVTALSRLRTERGIDAEVVIGDLSGPRGGALPPHVSHRSGRDIDIRLVLAPGLDRTVLPIAPEHVDWDATWALVQSFLETGDVSYVFLDLRQQAHLMEAGARAGVHPRVLDRWFQWPDGYDAEAIIRHEPGHRGHIHVRLRCDDQGPRCHGV
ncbi:MAG: penicillin-insensitive murein endopeptidase, partial [Nannocystaceae bacterium]|nr:penicillin-insensitive murein endopeptidase [Nannocystaceae bacterium]